MVDILLVEDDPRIADFLKRGLQAEGHRVEVAADGHEGLVRARSGRHELIILDRALPVLDGVELCRTLRGEGHSSMILILTARDSLQDRIEGLNSGADDYLGKPFAFDELLARTDALLRRSRKAMPETTAVIAVADLTLDTATKKARRGARAIALTAKEYALLECLARHAGAVVGRKRLLSTVWGLGFDPGTKVVDVYISYLRRKIDGAGEVPLIATVRGFGYMIGGSTEPEEPKTAAMPVSEQ